MILDRSLKPKRHQQKITLGLNEGHVSRAGFRVIEQEVDILACEGEYNEDLKKGSPDEVRGEGRSNFPLGRLGMQTSEAESEAPSRDGARQAATGAAGSVRKNDVANRGPRE